MKLKYLSVTNIRSYIQQEIHFPEGSLLLAGNVGSGKTTLLLAVEYALFGLQAGQRASAILRNNADKGEVILECELAGKEVRIERTLKREAKMITSDYASITLDGKKEECSVTELKLKVLQLLGYPLEFIKKHNLLYKYTVYTPQEQMKHIILEDADTRLSLIRHIFGIDKYKNIRDNLSLILIKIKDKSKSLQEEVKLIDEEQALLSQVHGRISNLSKEEEASRENLEIKRSQRKATEQEFASLEARGKEREQIEGEIEKTKIHLSSKLDLLSSLEKEIHTIQRQISQDAIFSQEEYESLQNELSLIKGRIEDLTAGRILLLSTISSLKQRKEELSSQKDRVFSIVFCPTCLQDVPEAHKHNILNKTESNLVDLEKKLSGYEMEREKLFSDSTLLQRQQHIIEEKIALLNIARSKMEIIAQARLKMLQLEKQRTALQQDIKILEQHLHALKEHLFSFSSFENLFRQKQEHLKQAFLSEKNAEIALAETRRELVILKQEIVRLSGSLAKKEASRTKLAYFSSLNDWLSTSFLNLVNFMETQVMMKIRKEFSRLFASWFSMIAGESFAVQLDEKFTPVIMHQGIEMDYSFLSGGERTAVALAYRLALNQTVNSVLSTIMTKDIIILDEPTEGFSGAQIDKIRDVLEELKVKQLILVSHEQEIESFVDHVIHIKKERSSSVVEEERIN